ncbi:MAG TPA: hypothetical protein VLL52_17470 [Anaerolineae bacterium]|nr:hypothetical protein [Anaerolineae bacterium]
MMGARHSAREGIKFLGRLGAECHAGTLGWRGGRGEVDEGREAEGM